MFAAVVVVVVVEKKGWSKKNNVLQFRKQTTPHFLPCGRRVIIAKTRWG